MSNRTNTYNAWEGSLAGTLGVGVLSVDFVSVVNLTYPLYVTLEPEVPGKLEYLKIINIVGDTVTFEARNLEGSVGDVQHDPGAIVRLTWTKQLQDDIFDDIETLEAADAAHEAAGNPHPGYVTDAELASAITGKVDVAGDTMTGELALPAGPPSGDTIATNKAYVDLQIAGGGLPSGVRMIFDMDAAPAGWTRDVSTVDDRMIRIVTGARADGGTWTQPDHSHSGGSHTHSGAAHTHAGPSHQHNETAHTHTIANHTHTNPSTSAAVGSATAQEDGGSNFSYAIGSHTHTQGDTGSGGTPVTGQNAGSQTAAAGAGATSGATAADTGSGSATTGDSATASSWRPLHRDMIIAVKD